jgi:hypothetical protein
MKKSSFATSTADSLAPTKKYLHNQVFYKEGLELKAEEKCGACVKQIGNLLENIRLVNPCKIMHAADETGGATPIGSKTQMINNVIIFLAYAPVGSNANAFRMKKKPIGSKKG